MGDRDPQSHPPDGDKKPPASAPSSGPPQPASMTAAIPRRTLPPLPTHPAAAHPPPAAGFPPGFRQAPPGPSVPPSLLNQPIPPPPAQPPAAAAPIPRKARAKALPTSRTRPSRALKREPEPHIMVKSENPFVLRILNATAIPINNGGVPLMRVSARVPKRKRPTYEESRDTDSGDFLTESDSDDDESFTKKGRLQKARRRSPADSMVSSGLEGSDLALTDEVIAEAGIDSPPPGTLSTLWYSREVYLNLFVIEKIIGWRTRPTVTLDWKDINDVKVLDPVEASSISTKLVAREEFWANQRKRMELSRINPAQCPIVMAVAAAKEAEAAKARQGEPRYTLAPRHEDQREEVLLVKWRGRSHVHCSWERRKDLEMFDPSNTARNKIRRYFQGQEILLGKNWRQIIEEERIGGGDAPTEDVEEAEQQAMEEEEFFPPQYLEVERILACDENEMDMNVLAKQRALNLRREQEEERKREEAEAKAKASGLGADAAHVHLIKPPGLLENLPRVTDEEEPWDPEDNVRYVVKWKGLQFAEITWEYWRDIKRDAVDEAEDFWYRQTPPPPAEVSRIQSRPHPHLRDFRKLPESPEFAVSRRPRPVADLGDGFTEDPRDDDEKGKAFVLRSYQLEGVNWLLFNWYNKRSCILADEMGLGKTIQTVCFLHQLNELQATQVRGPFLIVAPLTLIAQWQTESEAWAPDLNVVFYHGSADARDFLVQQEFYYTDQFLSKAQAMKLKKQHITKFHILITTYEVVLKDVDVLSKIRWKALIVDEAHRLKNPKARLFEELASVPRDFCLLLTGTPLQNSTEELWALLHFSDPKVFASKESFVDKFGQLTDAKQVSDLHAVLKPYLLRRVKEDVEKSLPPKEETILEVSLTPIQKTYYKAIYERNTTFLFKGAKPSNAPSLMNVMMELRKCCNHPFLIRGVEERILNDAAQGLKGQKDESGNEVPVDYLKLFGEHLVKSSGKMVLLEKLLAKLFGGGHKVLIFSQMVRALDLLEELLKIKKYRYERLDGTTSASARTAAVHRFHRNSCQRFVMLLSTRAGGLGLNLTAADTVIIFDSDWNPQNDLQAMARAHRIGQTRAVSVYRLLTSKTYEAHMLHSASMKLGLDRAVLAHQRQQGSESGEETKTKSKSDRESQAKEIDQLLKKGAYDIFRDEDDAEAKKFMESDIDQLLEKSAKKVTYGNASASSLSSGLGSFSKASFVADTGDGEKDVDLDDPDFWEKAVGLQAPEETPEEIENMIDDGVKRNRKQVQQFDPYAAFAEAEQRKQDKIAQKLKEEKEEKQRLRQLKKQQRLEEKERKKREKQEARGRRMSLSKKSSETKARERAVRKKLRGGKPTKKMKKSERRRALKRAENEDPILERLKQAWEVPQRNRATSAALRFGFGRFCKIRHESSLTSLPMQDLEVFVRQYVYQLSLQVAVSMLAMLRSKTVDAEESSLTYHFRGLLQQWLDPTSALELEWICSSITSVMRMQMDVENCSRFLRIPFILAEPAYMTELRQGAALRALRRIGILNRVNRLVEDSLDDIISGLGHEELGKRGCLTKDLSALDADLKARYVTTEELTLALGLFLTSDDDTRREPVAWWDRSCDVALIVGTFVHGFGNYESIRKDKDLPFANKIRDYAEIDKGCLSAFLRFDTATRSARKTFDAALKSAKSKDSEVQHMMVVAVMKATKQAEKEGESAASVVPSDIERPNIMEVDDSHLVTLPRIAKEMSCAIRNGGDETQVKTEERVAEDTAETKQAATKDEDDIVETTEVSLPLHKCLPMPDARILDQLLAHLLGIMEKNAYSASHKSTEGDSPSSVDWGASESVSAHDAVRSESLTRILGLSKRHAEAERREFRGIGFSGYQCGTVHRSLDDTSDYSIGAASARLSYVANGIDAPRYLRHFGVPMNFTRYAIVALVYSDETVLEQVLSEEESRAVSVQDAKAEEKKVDKANKETADEAGKAEKKEEAETTNEEKKEAVDPTNAEKKESSKQEEEAEAASQKEEAEKTEPDNEQETPSAAPALPIVLPEISGNHRLRAGICAAALHFGFPSLQSSGDESPVHSSIVASLHAHSPSFGASSIFGQNAFATEAGMFVNGGSIGISLESLTHYVESALLPHCLRLCIMGNGPTTRDARESRGRFENAYGYSLYPEHAADRQTPLPDPCCKRSEQSIEAVTCAVAILRRVRLLRAAQYIVSNDAEPLLQLLHSPALRESLNDLPIWWCPWIHDLALVVYAATQGLCSVMRPMDDSDNIFSPQAIQQHIHKSFFVDSTQPALAHLSKDQAADWIQEQAKMPSRNALERRLAYVCAQATSHLDKTHEARYDHLPMFDHGGWPRN